MYYPIGSVVCTATNTNPSSLYGGTWTLIDKKFSSYYNYTDTGNFTKNDTNVTSITDPVISRSGHSVSLKITFVNAVNLTGTNVTLGTWNWSKVGISSIGYTQEFIGLSEGNGILQLDIASSTGVMRSIDALARTGTVSGTSASNIPIPSGSTCYAEITFTVDQSRMLDSACDKFYWKKTGDDLTGTSWGLDSNIDCDTLIGNTYSINFSSNNTSYTNLSFVLESGSYGALNYNTTDIYVSGIGWTNENYRMITIINGTDTTNSTLINWLYANAAQI